MYMMVAENARADMAMSKKFCIFLVSISCTAIFLLGHSEAKRGVTSTSISYTSHVGEDKPSEAVKGLKLGGVKLQDSSLPFTTSIKCGSGTDNQTPSPLSSTSPPSCLTPIFSNPPQTPSYTIPFPPIYSAPPPPSIPLISYSPPPIAAEPPCENSPPALPVNSPPPMPYTPSPPNTPTMPSPSITYPSPPNYTPPSPTIPIAPSPSVTNPTPPSYSPPPPATPTIPSPSITYSPPPLSAPTLPSPPIIYPTPPAYNFPPPETPSIITPSPPPPPPITYPPPPYTTPPGTYLPPPINAPSPPTTPTAPSPPVSYVPYPPTTPAIPSPPTYPSPPPSTPSTPRAQGLWCVAKPTVPAPVIEQALNFACGAGVDCAPIEPDGSCFMPNTVISHASYAFNSYWQMTKASGGSCDFGGTAMLVTVDPSFADCHFAYNT